MNIINSLISNINVNDSENNNNNLPNCFGNISEYDQEIKEYYTNNNSFNYKTIFFGWQTDENKIYSYLEEVYNSPYFEHHSLIKAVKLEHGIDCEIDLKKAYLNYIVSAFVDKDSYAFYMLYKLHQTNDISNYYSIEAENEINKLLGIKQELVLNFNDKTEIKDKKFKEDNSCFYDEFNNNYSDDSDSNSISENISKKFEFNNMPDSLDNNMLDDININSNNNICNNNYSYTNSIFQSLKYNNSLESNNLDLNNNISNINKIQKKESNNNINSMFDLTDEEQINSNKVSCNNKFDINIVKNNENDCNNVPFTKNNCINNALININKKANNKVSKLKKNFNNNNRQDNYKNNNSSILNNKSSENFNLKYNRDRDLEMFYLICSVVYMPPTILFNTLKLRNLNPIHNFGYHLDIEDKNLTKCYYLLNEKIPSNYNKFKLNDRDIRYIKCILSLKFTINSDKINSMDLGNKIDLNLFCDTSFGYSYYNLNKLAKEGHIQSIGILAYINYSEDARILKKINYEKANELFNMLRPLYCPKNYKIGDFDSIEYVNINSSIDSNIKITDFNDVSILDNILLKLLKVQINLNNINDININKEAIKFICNDIEFIYSSNPSNLNKAIALCKYAESLNISKSFYYLYDLEFINISKQEDKGFNTLMSIINNLYYYLIKDLVIGGIYCIFEYINLKRFMEKYFDYKVPNVVNISQELFNLLNKKVKGEIQWIVFDTTGDADAEFNLCLGYYYYINGCFLYDKLNFNNVVYSSKADHLKAIYGIEVHDNNFFCNPKNLKSIDNKYSTKKLEIDNNIISPKNNNNELSILSDENNKENLLMSLTKLNENSYINMNASKRSVSNYSEVYGGSSININDNNEELFTDNDKVATIESKLNNCLKVLSLAYNNFHSCLIQCKTTSYKRFIIGFVVKVLRKKKILLEKILQNNNCSNIASQLNEVKSTLIKMENYLSSGYFNSIESMSLIYFSSSFFYQFGKILDNGIGTNVDETLALKYYLLGRYANFHIIGNGTNVCYFRKIKLNQILKENSKYNEVKAELKNKLPCYIEEELCDICFEKKKKKIFYPCKHMVCCDLCFFKVFFLGYCPICRGEIIAFV